VTARTCKCGCGTSLAGRRQGTVWATDGCRMAFKRANGAQGPHRRRTGPGGLQVAYPKALKAAYLTLVAAAPQLGPKRCHALAEYWMKQALPARQRERLEGRAK
jgi:hypothetical protein